MDVTQLEKLRPCGRLETYSTSRHHLGFYNNVALTATYTGPTSFTLPIENLVFAALHHVIAQHPNLSIILVNEEKSHPDVYFARLPEFDLRKCVEFQSRTSPIPKGGDPDPELDTLLQSQHSRGYKGNISTPCWRLAVTAFPGDPNKFTASWIFHHAISDGASSKMFHEAFLDGLNRFSQTPTDTVETIVATPSTPLAPCLEDLHPMTISWPFFLRAIGGLLLPGVFAPRSQGLWTGPPIPAHPQPSQTITAVLSADTSKRFAAECRKQGTSVTGALGALLSAAIFDILPPTHDEIELEVPISVRPFLNVQEKRMINAVTQHVSTLRRNVAGTTWPTARTIKSSLAAEVAKKGVDNPPALLKYVSDMSSFFKSKLGTLRGTTAEISNIGCFPSSSLGSWSMGRCVFSQSQSHTGAVVSLSVITGGDGCLVLCFNVPLDADLVDPTQEALHRIPETVKQQIETLMLS